MPVKNKVIKKPLFLPYRFLLSALALSFLAWLLLFALSLYQWVMQGFDEVFNRLLTHALNLAQAMEEFSSLAIFEKFLIFQEFINF